MADGKTYANATCSRTKISTIFFDLDNTLIPTRYGDNKACRKLGEILEEKFDFTREESTTSTLSFLKSFRRCPDNSQTSLDIWRTYLWREALPSQYKHLAEFIYPKWLKLRYRYLAVKPEYVDMLKSFHESRYLLGLITNGPSKAQWEKIQKLHLNQYFDCVLVSSDLPWEKPNRNIFYAACNYLGVKPEECAMVGDKLDTDILGGNIAGLGLTFWMPLNSKNIDMIDEMHPPHAILENLLDICKYFPLLESVDMRKVDENETNSLASNQFKRRASQISYSTKMCTCEYNELCDEHAEADFHCQEANSSQYNRYRRGCSLSALELNNSETENSSDSLFD